MSVDGDQSRPVVLIHNGVPSLITGAAYSNWFWEAHGREGQTQDEYIRNADGSMTVVRAPRPEPSP